MPTKKTTELQHEGVEYIDRNGRKVTADFRETDAKEWFERFVSHRRASDGSSGFVTVHRQSSLGKTLIARFPNAEDARDFATKMNENYRVLGKYTAVVGA